METAKPMGGLKRTEHFSEEERWKKGTSKWQWKKQEAWGWTVWVAPVIHQDVTTLTQPVVRTTRLERGWLMGTSTLGMCGDP